MSLLDISGQTELIEYAGTMLDRHDFFDCSTPSLLEVTGIEQHRMGTASGLNDYDYQNLNVLSGGLKNLNQLETVNKVSIPTEIMEHFKHIKCHCMMGLFPEISRAWLTIDSDIYIWTYEHARDVAYFDGLNHLIVSVGLIQPKPGVFIPDIKYLLVISTPIEIVILGVTFGVPTTGTTNLNSSFANTGAASGNAGGVHSTEEMQLINKPIFIINTDNIAITTIIGTEDYRIFLGGRDGCLYEICYQAESNWFGKRCKKINHSQSIVSYIVPGFLKVFSDVDSIVKIVVDESRHLLYTLSEKGSIEAWDLNTDHSSTRRIARISQNDIVNYAGNVLKTVDLSLFKSVVALCPLTNKDSPNLHLLAVTQSGVRLYFSTIPLISSFQPQQQQQQQQNIDNSIVGGQQQQIQQYDSIKPQSLYLLHVRLPPGYTPNASIGKPKQVHSAYYQSGTALMVSSALQDQDLLWSLSSEPFPLRPYLAESSTVLQLNGQVWGIAETKQSSAISSLQYTTGKRKIVMLTNQGAHILALLKPADLLEQLLISCQGPHNDALKNYFQIQSEQQACASCVLLACMNFSKNSEIGIWATQAFLLYGGEPKYGGQYLSGQQQQQFPIPRINDNQQQRNLQMFTSTPFYSSRPASSIQQSLLQQTKYPYSPITSSGGTTIQSQQQYQQRQQLHEPTNITYSAKHAGLYLHVCRLLRPIWNRRCVTGIGQILINHEDCSLILEDLYSIKNYIEQLMNNVSGYTPNYYAVGGTINHSYVQNSLNNQYSVEQAYAEEKRSVNALAVFIKHTCEVMGLWKILCEHQFHVLFGKLSKDDQLMLLSCSFRDLILSRADTCAMLIVALINSYLNDNATIGSISSKLRDVCPNLYRHEDAVTHKATEILMLSRTCTDKEERKEKLYTALQLCKDAAPNLPLSNICQQFVTAKFYHGVIELCSVCANKLDVNGAALHYYKNNEPAEDQEGYLAYSARMNCYNEIKLMLDQCYLDIRNAIANNNNTMDLNNETIILDNNNNNQQQNRLIQKIIAIALNAQDQLLHIAVYEWLLSHDLLSELLDISDPTLGDFLTHAVQKNQDNHYLANILWKYHEQNGNHTAAAQILDTLASVHSTKTSLDQRIEYLARAVLCMRSDNVGYSAHSGVLLKNLEDKLEIARIQKQILDALTCIPDHNNIANDSIQLLNCNLYDMTQLYTDFAERFELWECKLTILNCSHHNDSLLIESVWSHILDAAISINGSPYEKSSHLLLKFKLLAKEYIHSGHCFPISFLVRELEIRCCRLHLDHFPVPNTLIGINIDIILLLDIYSKMISMNERVWIAEGNEWHLIESIISLVSILAGQPNLIPIRIRPRIVSKAQDIISACRTLLYPKPDTKLLIDNLVDVEMRLQRILLK